jgi:hypothetical protein
MDKKTIRKILVVVACILVAVGIWGIVETSVPVDSPATVAEQQADTSADETEAADAAEDESVSEGENDDDTQSVAESAISNASTDTSSSSSSTPSEPASSVSSAASESASSSSAQESQSPAAETITVTQSVNGGAARSVTVDAGATVFDVLKASGVSYVNQPSAYGAYITAIDGVATDAKHGWVYAVNGTEPNTGCSNYKVSQGDAISWTYIEVK